MELKNLKFVVRDGIGTITVNRPEVMNALNVETVLELGRLVREIHRMDEVGGVIVTGAGEKAFCAGADLSEFLTAPSPVIARQVRWERDVWGLFLGIPQPVIAALHGYVLGSGIEIALCCDIRIASEDVRFGLPEVGLGIIPAAGGTQTLPRAIGRSRALEMLLTNRWVEAEEALRIGLVNRVVPKKQLLESAEEIAGKIASHDPVAVRYAKQAVLRGLELPLNEGLDLERRLAKELAARVERESVGRKKWK